MHPFALQHTLLAKHAQHIVLVHFPIALSCAALLFDLLAIRQPHSDWPLLAYYNLTIAASATLPVVATGLIAWQWQLEAAPLRGTLQLHLLLGLASSLMIWTTWLIARRDHRSWSSPRLAMEVITVGFVAVTAHLGGVVSGVIG